LTWGALVQRSLLAAQQAEKDGISVMVVDPRTIAPFDWDAIAAAEAHESCRHRAEDQLTCGFGAELPPASSTSCSSTDARAARRGARYPDGISPVLEELSCPSRLTS
jgi:pyruvate/2-oxoglutarate/acetoin dehydrogenase E1 component